MGFINFRKKVSFSSGNKTNRISSSYDSMKYLEIYVELVGVHISELFFGGNRFIQKKKNNGVRSWNNPLHFTLDLLSKYILLFENESLSKSPAWTYIYITYVYNIWTYRHFIYIVTYSGIHQKSPFNSAVE